MLNYSLESWRFIGVAHEESKSQKLLKKIDYKSHEVDTFDFTE